MNEHHTAYSREQYTQGQHSHEQYSQGHSTQGRSTQDQNAVPPSNFVPAGGNMPAHARGTGQAQKQKKKKLYNILLVFFTTVLCVCLIAIGVIMWGYFQGSRMYSDIAAKTTLSTSDEDILSTEIDWDALLAINPETIAWVYVPGTDINYPVVQTTNNEKYLKTDFQGEVNWVVSFGAIFLDYQCESDFSNQNNFMYGHNMNDGSMFAVLATFADNQVFNEHRDVYVFTPLRNYKLESFALLHVDANDTLVQPTTGSDARQRAYVQTQLDRSIVTPSEGFPDAGSVDRTFVLVTCDNLPTDGRYALYCRMVDSTLN